MRIERSRKRWPIALGVFVCVALFSFLVLKYKSIEKVGAASLAGFDPGYIISDYQMGNYNSMNEGEIQNFLSSKNGCGNRDYGYYLALSSNPNYRWHFENGHFICLSEERFGYNDNEIGFQYGESAAHIIWQAAQDYRINPQVLLVLLQKETGLITDPIPNNGDYRKATGYGCPDTAACSSQYYGFRNQIRNAAALFRTVLDGGWTNYPLGNNYIQYNPNGACGGSIVNVRSRATSALYRYTPYQPNAGALAAGYGTASCGAYGNRNFYLYFEDWFGGITNEKHTLTVEEVRNNMPKMAVEKNDLPLKYNVHVADLGWMDPPVNGGEMTGTVGYAIRMEALSISLESLKGIEYRSHIQDIGWENDYKKDGEVSGTTGRSLRLEAVQIKLNKQLSEEYDIYYRAHVADIGWMDWVMNGEVSGTTGESRQMEALQIKIIKKNNGLSYRTHVADLGWMDWVNNGEMAGTTVEPKQMEAINLDFSNFNKNDVLYRVHVADLGWMDWVNNGEMAGTTGQARRMEAIEIKLNDSLVGLYDLKYRVRVADLGWMDWVNNGEMAGTTGQARRMEAIEIQLRKK